MHARWLACVEVLRETLKKDENVTYRKDPKFSDRYVKANSADPEQTAPRGAV